MTVPLAAITLMLWIIWSDQVRRRKPGPILYYFRVALYLFASGVLLVNLVRLRGELAAFTITLSVIAVLIGFGGAYYFFIRARSAPRP